VTLVDGGLGRDTRSRHYPLMQPAPNFTLDSFALRFVRVLDDRRDGFLAFNRSPTLLVLHTTQIRSTASALVTVSVLNSYYHYRLPHQLSWSRRCCQHSCRNSPRSKKQHKPSMRVQVAPSRSLMTITIRFSFHSQCRLFA